MNTIATEALHVPPVESELTRVTDSMQVRAVPTASPELVHFLENGDVQMDGALYGAMVAENQALGSAAKARVALQDTVDQLKGQNENLESTIRHLRDLLIADQLASRHANEESVNQAIANSERLRGVIEDLHTSTLISAEELDAKWQADIDEKRRLGKEMMDHVLEETRNEIRAFLAQQRKAPAVVPSHQAHGKRSVSVIGGLFLALLGAAAVYGAVCAGYLPVFRFHF